MNRFSLKFPNIRTFVLLFLPVALSQHHFPFFDPQADFHRFSAGAQQVCGQFILHLGLHQPAQLPGAAGSRAPSGQLLGKALGAVLASLLFTQ